MSTCDAPCRAEDESRVDAAVTPRPLHIVADGRLSTAARAPDAQRPSAAPLSTHGAGVVVGMTHPCMPALADALAAQRRVAVKFGQPIGSHRLLTCAAQIGRRWQHSVPQVARPLYRLATDAQARDPQEIAWHDFG